MRIILLFIVGLAGYILGYFDGHKRGTRIGIESAIVEIERQAQSANHKLGRDFAMERPGNG